MQKSSMQMYQCHALFMFSVSCLLRYQGLLLWCCVITFSYKKIQEISFSLWNRLTYASPLSHVHTRLLFTMKTNKLYTNHDHLPHSLWGCNSLQYLLQEITPLSLSLSLSLDQLCLTTPKHAHSFHLLK